MTDKEKIFKMFDSPDTSNHYVAWEICKGLGISLNEVFEYMLVKSKRYKFSNQYIEHHLMYIPKFLDFYIQYYIRESWNNKGVLLMEMNVWRMIAGNDRNLNFYKDDNNSMKEVIREIIDQLGGELNE